MAARVSRAINAAFDIGSATVSEFTRTATSKSPLLGCCTNVNWSEVPPKSAPEAPTSYAVPETTVNVPALPGDPMSLVTYDCARNVASVFVAIMLAAADKSRTPLIRTE